MNYLQYTSKEMVSATQLIRKSKTVFDSVATGKIDKAVVLRDGKPSFILLDFEKYELLMNEYVKMKEEKRDINHKKETKSNNHSELKIEEQIKELTQEFDKRIENNEEDTIPIAEEKENPEEYQNNEKYEDNDILKDFWK